MKIYTFHNKGNLIGFVLLEKALNYLQLQIKFEFYSQSPFYTTPPQPRHSLQVLFKDQHVGALFLNTARTFMLTPIFSFLKYAGKALLLEMKIKM